MHHDGGEAHHAPTRVVATWPRGSFAENVAVAPDGGIFVTLHTDRAIVRVDPSTGVVTPFAVFGTPVAGLAFARDGSLVVSGGTPGSRPGVVWHAAPDGTIRRLVELPDAAFLNGVTPFPDGERFLVADSLGGAIHWIDLNAGRAAIWLRDERLASVNGTSTPGANGVKLRAGYAYISVTDTDTLWRSPVTHGVAGDLEPVAERLRADDFAFDDDGNLFIATHPAHSLVRLGTDGTRTTLAGAEHGLVGATAVAFGRSDGDRHAVYVTTTGGTMLLPSAELQPAKLVRVDVGVAGWPLLTRDGTQ